MRRFGNLLYHCEVLEKLLDFPGSQVDFFLFLFSSLKCNWHLLFVPEPVFRAGETPSCKTAFLHLLLLHSGTQPIGPPHHQRIVTNYSLD